jgi:hypothetical protein
LSGLGFGFSQLMIFVNYGVVFYCGSIFFKDVDFWGR